MNHSRWFGRWTPPAVGLCATALSIAVVTAMLMLSHDEGGASTAAPLWTDRPVLGAQAAPAGAPWVELARQLKPAVVNISATRADEGPAARGLGSGFIISSHGDVVTNDHVIDGAMQVRVTLSDGRDFRATVVGRDPTGDLALLRIDATGLPVIPLGDSSRVEVGQAVMAIGNPFGLEQTVTTGIVSATGRGLGAGLSETFIQTDASINPGNSGGPLINTRGQAIGINTAIVTAGGGSNGIGFAIPIGFAEPVLVQLARTGRVDRGWLGVDIQSLTAELATAVGTPGEKGALVAAVSPDSPAMHAGIARGDVIAAYAGRPVARAEDLSRAIAETPTGREVAIAVRRAGRVLVLNARIGLRIEGRASAPPARHEQASLGLTVRSITAEGARELGVSVGTGVLVVDVAARSRGASAGIQPGDVILEADWRPVTSAGDLERRMTDPRGGTPVLMLVHRDRHHLFVVVD